MRPKNVNNKDLTAQRRKGKRILFPKYIRITKEVKRSMEKSNKPGDRFGKKWYPYNK